MNKIWLLLSYFKQPLHAVIDSLFFPLGQLIEV